VTVVVALVGRDAIVLAADSQETAGTVKSTTHKLRIIGDRMAWGGAGDSALVQRITATQEPIASSLADERWKVASAIGGVTRPVQRSSGSLTAIRTQSNRGRRSALLLRRTWI